MGLEINWDQQINDLIHRVESIEGMNLTRSERESLVFIGRCYQWMYGNEEGIIVLDQLKANITNLSQEKVEKNETSIRWHLLTTIADFITARSQAIKEEALSNRDIEEKSREDILNFLQMIDSYFGKVMGRAQKQYEKNGRVLFGGVPEYLYPPKKPKGEGGLYL